MNSIEPARIQELLDGPHQGVLSVSRRDRGPVAVPMSYHYTEGSFFIVTSDQSLHGKLMVTLERATLTVQFEACTGRTVHQWYVMAEGDVRFTDADPKPHVRKILAKDRGAANVDEWMAAVSSSTDMVAVLQPVRISGYEGYNSLDA